MRIGAMNNPGNDVLSEIEWMRTLGLDFIDLTLEPPMAAPEKIDVASIAKALQDAGMTAVGHTAYYLPLASPFEALRRAAVEELKKCLDVFAQLGVRWMNLHPDRHAPFHTKRFVAQKNLETVMDLLPLARQYGIGLMVENIPGHFNRIQELSELLDPVPELGLHLDIGHANLMTEKSTAEEIIAAYGSRLRHVHLHDNKGGTADLHLPLGTGTVELSKSIQALVSSGYDSTITLEVFSPDRNFLAYSRDVLRRIWEECRAAAESASRTLQPAAGAVASQTVCCPPQAQA